jgi:hypothetical protein
VETMRQYTRDDVEFSSWYTPWMKSLAANYSKEELQNKLGKSSYTASKAASRHLAAIDATSSMAGQSARRAHARNCVSAAGEEGIALRGAIEIHDLFPEMAKR